MGKYVKKKNITLQVDIRKIYMIFYHLCQWIYEYKSLILILNLERNLYTWKTCKYSIIRRLKHISQNKYVFIYI